MRHLLGGITRDYSAISLPYAAIGVDMGIIGPLCSRWIWISRLDLWDAVVCNPIGLLPDLWQPFGRVDQGYGSLGSVAWPGNVYVLLEMRLVACHDRNCFHDPSLVHLSTPRQHSTPSLAVLRYKVPGVHLHTPTC